MPSRRLRAGTVESNVKLYLCNIFISYVWALAETVESYPDILDVLSQLVTLSSKSPDLLH